MWCEVSWPTGMQPVEMTARPRLRRRQPFENTGHPWARPTSPPYSRREIMDAVPEQPPFSECAAATDDLPLRQGDVIEALAPADPESRFGVVVTADCDIAQLKHNNTVSYVPLFVLPRYVAAFYIPRRLERILKQLREDLTRRATTIRQQQHPDSAPFSEGAIDVWVEGADGAAIAAALEAPADKRRNEFIALADTYRAARLARGAEDLEAGVKALTLVSQYRGSTAEKALSKTWDEIHGYVRDLPGDAFFIGSIGEVPELRVGFIAYLRVLRELHPTQVALRPADLRSADVRVKRIARLRSPYLYRLTQQLASVFSSIGLPTAYETERDRIASVLRGDEAL